MSDLYYAVTWLLQTFQVLIRICEAEALLLTYFLVCDISPHVYRQPNPLFW